MQKILPLSKPLFSDSLAEKVSPKFRILEFFTSLEQRFSNRFMATSYIMLSNIFFTVVGILTKLSHEIPPYQLTYNRAFYEIILSSLTVVLINSNIYPRNAQTYKLLLLRGFLGGLGLTMFFHAIYYLPISICTVLFMLTPLWIGMVTFFQERRIQRWTFLSMVASFGGMVLIIKPGFRENEGKSEGIGFYIGAFLAISTSIVSGIVAFSIKTLKGKADIATIASYFNGFNLLFSGFGQIFEGIKVLTWGDHGVLFLLGIMGWSGQMLRARALMVEEVFFVSIMMYAQIAMAYLADVFILQIQIDWLSNIGCLVIGTAMICLVYLEQK